MTGFGNVDAIGGGNLVFAGTGTSTQASGSSVGSDIAGTTGTITVNGGVLNIGGTTGGVTGVVFIGGNLGFDQKTGTGVLTINGGTVNVGPATNGGPSGLDASQLWLAPYGQLGTDTLNLNGGTLSTARDIRDGTSGQSLINFNGGTLQAALTDTSGNFIGSNGGTINLHVLARGAVIDTQGFNVAISQVLAHGSGSPDGGLTKLGSGTLTLNANNTYNGTTTINAGTLSVIGSNGSTGRLTATPSITVNNGGTLSIGATDALGYTAGTAALVINNGGTVTATAGVRQTIVNNITMTGGTLSSAAGNGDGSGDYSLFNVGIIATSDPTTGNPAVINATSFSDETANTNITFNVTRGAMAPASDLNVSSAIIPYVFTSTPNTGITKTGNGIMTLSGESTFTGSTLINGGILRVANASGGFNQRRNRHGQFRRHVGRIAVAEPGIHQRRVSVSSGGAIAGSNGNTLTLNGGLTLASGAGMTFNLTGSPRECTHRHQRRQR